MANDLQTISLGKILKRVKEDIQIQDDVIYKQVRVRLWNKGVILRGKQQGSEIKTKRQFIIKEAQLILSRIDVRNGAIGLCPPELDGAIITNDFWAYDFDYSLINPKFLEFYVKTPRFIDDANRTSSGTTKRIRSEEEAFLRIKIPLLPLPEQQRIVGHIEALTERIVSSQSLRKEIDTTIHEMLLSAFLQISNGARKSPMHIVAPITRRPILIDAQTDYYELGIRSFGRGTFHKSPISGSIVGTKKIFAINPSDLVFSNVFAWEGAVAVAKPEDKGRVGSHRFITCVPKDGLATANYLCFYFLTTDGLEKLGIASPGGAGRNRTLGLDALGRIEVPVPDYNKQLWFDKVLEKVSTLRAAQVETQKNLDALLPSILDKAFKGEL